MVRYSFVPRLLISRETLGRIPQPVVNHLCSVLIIITGVAMMSVAVFIMSFALEIRDESLDNGMQTNDSPFAAMATSVALLGLITVGIGVQRNGYETRNPRLLKKNADKLMHFRALYVMVKLQW